MFNAKAKERIVGLRVQKVKKHKNSILVHCASAGEFEQIQAVIEEIQMNSPETEIILSFFSPSGVKWIASKGILHKTYYLPFDKPKVMRNFIETIEPSKVLIVKNEIWLNMFHVLDELSIPHYLVAASFKEKHFALRIEPYIKTLQNFSKIFCLDEMSLSQTSNILSNSVLGGDPRVDRIMNLSSDQSPPELFDKKYDKPLFVYGSVHLEDIGIIKKSIKNNDFLHIIVPHDVDEMSIRAFTKKLDEKVELYTDITAWNLNHLVVNKIGILSRIYKIASFTYIGGGFGHGIHNILEPAIWHNIIFIGTKNQKFVEARNLLSSHSIIEVDKNVDISRIASQLTAKDIAEMQQGMKSFFDHNNDVSSNIARQIMNEK